MSGFHQREVGIFLLLTLAVLLIRITAALADDAERIAKAKAEGQAMFYSTMGIDSVRPVTLPFEKKFPFLKVEALRLNSERLFNRVAKLYRKITARRKHSS